MEKKTYLYTCSYCETVNRVRNPALTNGRWRCGKCKAVIFHKVEKFHDSLIQKARDDLQLLYEEIAELSKIRLLTGGTAKIEKKWTKIASRIGQWNDHVEFSQDEEWIARVKESYKADLKEIDTKIKEISALIDEKNWLKSLVKQNDRIRFLVNGIHQGLLTMTGILGVFGITFGFENILKAFSYEYLENKDAEPE